MVTRKGLILQIVHRLGLTSKIAGVGHDGDDDDGDDDDYDALILILQTIRTSAMPVIHIHLC